MLDLDYPEFEYLGLGHRRDWDLIHYENLILHETF